MARFNEILVGRYNRALQKLTGIKGFVPSPQLASEIMPVLSLFRGAEDRYVESWNRFVWPFNPGASGAGFVNSLRLRNPSTSNVIAVVESIIVSAPANDQVVTSHGAQAADLPTSQSTANFRLDPRGNPSGASLIASTAKAVQAFYGQGIVACFIAANTPFQVIYDLIQEVPLIPGDALDIGQTTVNGNFNVTMIWRERFLEESERA